MADIELGKNGRPEGGDALGNVRLNYKKKVRINPDFKTPKVRIKEVDMAEKKFKCCVCGDWYTGQKGNFPSGGSSILWKGNNGYLPFCKSCCDKLFGVMTDFYDGNEEHALRHLCSWFDWYYCDAASAMTLSQAHTGQSRALLYPSKASMRNVVMKGTTFLDTIRDENKDGEIIKDSSEVPDTAPEDADSDEFVVTKEIIRAWGTGYSPDQYRYLEDQYADWVARNVCNTKTQEELYKNIAIAQLNIRIAQQNGGKVSEAMKAMQDLMNSANILPKQTAENILADTQTFGTLLKKFEETRPVPEAAPEWRDVDGIRKYVNTYVRGGLGKALRIRNENTQLYDEAVEELAKYTVTRDDAGGSADGMGSAIFDSQHVETVGGSDGRD